MPHSLVEMGDISDNPAASIIR